jgi:hypothetical protein
LHNRQKENEEDVEVSEGLEREGKGGLKKTGREKSWEGEKGGRF